LLLSAPLEILQKDPSGTQIVFFSFPSFLAVHAKEKTLLRWIAFLTGQKKIAAPKGGGDLFASTGDTIKGT